jgi:hypothetical protein
MALVDLPNTGYTKDLQLMVSHYGRCRRCDAQCKGCHRLRHGGHCKCDGSRSGIGKPHATQIAAQRLISAT